jgi:hypothetical protein
MDMLANTINLQGATTGAELVSHLQKGVASGATLTFQQFEAAFTRIGKFSFDELCSINGAVSSGAQRADKDSKPEIAEQFRLIYARSNSAATSLVGPPIFLGGSLLGRRRYAGITKS